MNCIWRKWIVYNEMKVNFVIKNWAGLLLTDVWFYPTINFRTTIHLCTWSWPFMVELRRNGGLTKRLNMSTPHGRFFEGSIQFDASCMKKCWNGVSGRWGSIWFSLHKRWWGSKKYILWLSPFDVVRNRNSTCCRHALVPSHFGFPSLIWFTLCNWIMGQTQFVQ